MDSGLLNFRYGRMPRQCRTLSVAFQTVGASSLAAFRHARPDEPLPAQRDSPDMVSQNQGLFHGSDMESAHPRSAERRPHTAASRGSGDANGHICGISRSHLRDGQRTRNICRTRCGRREAVVGVMRQMRLWIRGRPERRRSTG